MARGYSSRLTVVSRGSIGGADTPGKGGMGGWELIPILSAVAITRLGRQSPPPSLEDFLFNSLVFLQYIH